MRRWCAALGATRRRRYVKPKLSAKQRCARLQWVITKYDKRRRMFHDCRDVAHGDEKWFYMLREGSVCRVFPTFRLNGDKEIESQVKMPACPKLYHKSRHPQVMFLAVTAKPRPEYSFDVKVGIWSFTRLRKANRSVKKTGTVAGETDILESVSVTAEEDRHVMLKRGGVFDTLRQKMWWFARDADTPEAA